LPVPGGRGSYKNSGSTPCTIDDPTAHGSQKLDEYAVRRAQAGPPGREALERNAPNLWADYLYLWETTVVRQAIETATTSVSSGGHSSSY